VKFGLIPVIVINYCSTTRRCCAGAKQLPLTHGAKSKVHQDLETERECTGAYHRA
jgi:hypothetical protein